MQASDLMKDFQLFKQTAFCSDNQCYEEFLINTLYHSEYRALIEQMIKGKEKRDGMQDFIKQVMGEQVGTAGSRDMVGLSKAMFEAGYHYRGAQSNPE